MKGLSYMWRMALRRKAACLLVLLFAMAATVFMLVYPGLIDSTKARLEEAYDNIVVKGWVLNGEDYSDPVIPGEKWHQLVDSGYFSDHASYGKVGVRIYEKDELMAEIKGEDNDKSRLQALQTLLSRERSGFSLASGRLRAYNKFSSSDELLRAKDTMVWLDGYDESCIEGDERICILSDQWGYEPGEIVPMLASYEVKGEMEFVEGIFRMKVVATYKGRITGFHGVIPIKTMEELCNVANVVQQDAGNSTKWPFTLSSFIFTIKDNRQLDEVKDYLINGEMGAGGGIRAAVDDRILKGTVSPIESNLALLEGLYQFFFVMVTAIGFFLSFLLARGRKPEYAVMRMLGETRTQITLKALFEQCILCLCGIILGAVAVILTAAKNFDPRTCAVILLCYSLGAALAVMLTVRVNVMEILRDKE